MSDTREKLLEARYFLGRMKEVQADRAAFKYNLSAFLSAARSVTFYMQKEFKRATGFDEWYEAEQQKMRRDPIMPFFVEARNVSLKQQHVPTRAQVGVKLTATATGTASLGKVVIRVDGSEEKIAPEESEPEQPAEPTRSDADIEWKWYFIDPPPGAEENDVVVLCADYVSRLEDLVNRCEEQFAS